MAGVIILAVKSSMLAVWTVEGQNCVLETVCVLIIRDRFGAALYV
jgi:hypothetical protein